MTIWDRLLGRGTAKGDAPPADSGALGIAGPLTARRAYELALPHVHRLDTGALLTAIVSDSSIDHGGLSREWELSFDLPGRGEAAQLRIAPSAEQDPWSELVLSLTRRPFTEPLADLQFAQSLARSLGISVAELESRRCSEAQSRRPAGLPAEFRDSPAAVASFAAQGVDFVAGPTDLTLSTRRDKAGDPVWVVQDRQRDYETPFVDQ
jgi:hypothetical protein